MVQDADLEYDPVELAVLLGPLMAGQADVVYGSRFLSDRPHRVLLCGTTPATASSPRLY